MVYREEIHITGLFFFCHDIERKRKSKTAEKRKGCKGGGGEEYIEIGVFLKERN
jgi:hypothetical protein